MTIAESVEALDATIFESHAVTAAEQLHEFGSTFVQLEPGDGTSYRITVVRPREFGEVAFKVFNGEPVHGWKMTDRYWVATQFGPLYEMNPMGGYRWGYVADHWLPDMKASQEWTARVLARFLNALCDQLKETE